MMVMEGRPALEEWFRSRGFELADPSDFEGPSGRPDMAFSGPRGTAFLVVADEKLISDRNYFMEAVMRASSLRRACNYLYLAVPKLAVPFVDAEVLRKHGIGLLMVDGDRVVEVLASPYRPVEEGKPGQEASIEPGMLTDLLDRLSALEQRLSVLERELMALRPLAGELKVLRGLREEIRALSTRVDVISKRLDSLSASISGLRPTGPVAPSPAPPTPSGPPRPELEGLPSFFKDNPWLDILSRRGQDEIPA